MNPDRKVCKALPKIYGLGQTLSNQICDRLGFSENYKIKSLTNVEIEQLSHLITENSLTGGEKRHRIQTHLKRLISIGCYRGKRHTIGLPVRGQRTHTNARTAKKIIKWRSMTRRR